MTISELISKLLEIQRTHGDLTVYTYEQDLDWISLDTAVYVDYIHGWEADPATLDEKVMCVKVGVNY